MSQQLHSMNQPDDSSSETNNTQSGQIENIHRHHWAIVGNRKRRNGRIKTKAIHVGVIVGESSETTKPRDDQNNSQKERLRSRSWIIMSYRCIGREAKKLAQKLGIIRTGRVELKRSAGYLV
mmetsp:Transcript_1760/g.2674  ORF Transcript_1760/g.2674 Transcript_1760/m.2674 type:complete len:122 (-) Transcript_1760:776-1141(-)|eukprot:CAMPEP_0194216320 /NCGR_PEP_ID=MMETSP0156-20130528/18762_1 /TAXON_ID=33649 /ORGANISM="Thalassionema nitzschioides, Strain L26-B" /LENGTH=121 /DNA_ID=CAMNT_0038945065 /DNA_START=73 /DNA_END=438 /DNA_ORIENTATION=-